MDGGLDSEITDYDLRHFLVVFISGQQLEPMLHRMAKIQISFVGIGVLLARESLE